MLKDMVDRIVGAGANVVFVQKGIDDSAQHFLAKEEIYAIRRAKKSDMEKLSRATGARIVKQHPRTDQGGPGQGWPCRREEDRRR